MEVVMPPPHKNFRQEHLLNQDPDQNPRCPDPYPTKKVEGAVSFFAALAPGRKGY
jgi:hypothetical protein